MSAKRSLPLLGQPHDAGPGDDFYEHIAADLQCLDVGQVRFSRHERNLWSTDASAYQVWPIGVVVPNSLQQARRALAYCVEHRLPVLPRGGGTSLAGQCTNHAVIIDFSAGCRRLLEINPVHRTCIVEPGIGIEELNRELIRRGENLFFAPDPATSAQAAVGGCIGNNAAGARSIRYGRTSENVSGVEVLLASGEQLWLQPGAARSNAAALRLADAVSKVVLTHSDAIRRRFPKLVRRNAGYALDLVLNQLDHGIAAADLDLSGLICGSEGTLAIVTQARLKLHPRPIASGLAMIAFESLTAAIDAVNPILATRPTAVELLDEVVLRAAQQNSQCRRYVERLPQYDGRPPQAVLYVEYQAVVHPDEIATSFAALKKLLDPHPVATFTNVAEMADAWTLRKSSEALLHGLSSYRKPVTFVEDNAVPVEALPRFVREFNRIVDSHGTTAAFYAHASVGVLHVRPLLDLHETSDRQAMRDIAVEIADLARDCGGVMSGEHGDGRVRGPLLERFYGEEVMEAFRQVKRIFDPSGILNPGMIVDAGPVTSITENLRIGPVTARQSAQKINEGQIETYFDYSDQESFRGAVEMCNGAGFCRKISGGAMCPSYRATLDERHSPRGRANALREALLRQSLPPVLGDPATLATLDLCLSCKACKTECPSNVDIARLKAEYLAQSYKAGGRISFATRLFGHVHLLNRWGSRFYKQANWMLKWAPVAKLTARMLKLAPERRLPEFAPSLFKQLARQPLSTGDLQRPRVIVFADCFTAYNEPDAGVALIRLLERLGYRVDIPDIGCCGRALISTGLLPQARRTIEKSRAALMMALTADDNAGSDVRAILFLEPSCLSAVKDDWLSLKLSGDKTITEALAKKSMSAEDFIEKFWDEHPNRPELSDAARIPSAIYHAHCHQKALSGTDSGTAIFRRLQGEKFSVLDSGCCGMAGSFGYTRDHFDISMKIGELSLFAPVRAASRETVILAPGTSCRHQISDGTGRQAIHPIVLLEKLLKR